jgi:hypothetical protein
MLVTFCSGLASTRNQVRPLAGGDDSEGVLRLEVLADVGRPGLDDVVGRDAGIRHVFISR